MKGSFARVVRRKVLLILTQLLSALFFILGAYLSYRGQYEKGPLLMLCGAVTILFLCLPALREYRAVWRQESACQSYGRYAAQVELETDPEQKLDQLLMLSLIPLAQAKQREYRFQCRVRGFVRERLLEVTDLSLPMRINGRLTRFEGCLIHMSMPRAPITRLLIADTRLGGSEALTAFYRRNLRLLPLDIQLGGGLIVLGEGQLPDTLTLDRLEALFRQADGPMVLSLEGRELNLLVSGGSALLPAPRLRLTRARFSRIPLPQVPQIIDLAFDTSDLTAGRDVAIDDSLDRKLAGVRSPRQNGEGDPYDGQNDAPGDL